MSRRLMLGLVATALVAVGAILFAIPRGSTVDVSFDWTLEDGCPDAVLIGAAGSGQRDDILGVGPQVESTVSAFVDQLTERASSSVSVGFTALDYPAPDFIEGTLQALRGDTMFGSIEEGRTTMISLVGDIDSQCTDSGVYLIGFSQGASVVHTSIVEMPLEYRDAIAGAVVLANPYRDADDPNAQHFTNQPDPNRSGDPSPHTRDGSLTAIALPDWVNGSFYSACAQRDTVCNFALRDLFATEAAHTEPAYHGLGPQLGRLLADDLLGRL
ncbi:MAG: cutinase family protein [Acidimicrobiia bacterium]|nr:cutinase family protein [Acidimicrobiia bacterium]